MALSVPLTGWAANDPVPSFLTEVAFAQGPASAGTGTYAILLIGNKLAAGTATADTVIYGPDTATPLATAQDAINLFGAGSEMQRMFKRVTSVNTTTPVYAICPLESTGVQATLAITFVNAATANATGRIFLGDDSVDFAITNGDAIATIAANAATAVNAKPDAAMTATSSLGVLTLTARQKGLRGNWLRGGASVIGTGAGTTVSPGPMAYFSGGTVADSWTNALATIVAKRYYYIISADDGGQSSPNLAALTSQALTQALPTNGLLQTVIAASNDATPANTTTTAIAQNSPRCEYYHFMAGDAAPSEIAALMGGAFAAYEAGHGSATLNGDLFGSLPQSQALWKLLPPRTGQQLTRTQVVSALNNGVSPIWLDTRGKPFLVSRITTKSQTASVADYRIRDAHKVRICDWFSDDLKSLMTLQFAGKTIASDPATPAQKPPPGAVYPQLFKRTISQLLGTYNDAGLVQNLAAIIAGTTTLRESATPTRLSAYIPLQPVDVAHQGGAYIAQVA